MFNTEFITGAFFDVYLTGNLFGLAGQFLSVSGLNMEFEYETYCEGGSSYPRQFFKNAVPQTLVLEQGTVTDFDNFSLLMHAANLGTFAPMVGVILLKDNTGSVKREWTIMDAYLTKYIGPNLESREASLAVTRIELSYGGCI